MPKDIDDEYRRVPVDRVAARVVRDGEWFTPKKVVTNHDSEMPLRVRKITREMRNNQSFTDLTEKSFGRFKVIGLSNDFDGQWVVVCKCGRYSTRSKKAILNKNNDKDRCEHCRHLDKIKRTETWRRYGVDAEIED